METYEVSSRTKCIWSSPMEMLGWVDSKRCCWPYSITVTTVITEFTVKGYHIFWRRRWGLFGKVCYRRSSISILVFFRFTSMLIWVMSCTPASFRWRVYVAHTLTAILKFSSIDSTLIPKSWMKYFIFITGRTVRKWGSRFISRSSSERSITLTWDNPMLIIYSLHLQVEWLGFP